MARANESALDALHAAVAEVLTEALSAKTVDGEPAEVSPQMIAQAIKFLKNNGIDAPATSKRFDELMGALDDLDLDEAAQRYN